MRRLARRDSRTHKSHAPCTVSCLRHLERSTEVAPRRLLLQAERYSESHTFLRSVFVLQRKVHRLRSWRRAAGKARITLGAMPVRAPLILQSSPSPESIDSVRGRSSSAPREAWTEHEHHRIELHRSVLFVSWCSLMAWPYHAARVLACALHMSGTDLYPCCVCKDACVDVLVMGVWSHCVSNPVTFASRACVLSRC